MTSGWRCTLAPPFLGETPLEVDPGQLHGGLVGLRSEVAPSSTGEPLPIETAPSALPQVGPQVVGELHRTDPEPAAQVAEAVLAAGSPPLTLHMVVVPVHRFEVARGLVSLDDSIVETDPDHRGLLCRPRLIDGPLYQEVLQPLQHHVATLWADAEQIGHVRRDDTLERTDGAGWPEFSPSRTPEARIGHVGQMPPLRHQEPQLDLLDEAAQRR